MAEKKVKFNVIDVIIIVIAAAAIVLGVTAVVSGGKISGTPVKVQYTVLLSNQPLSLSEAIKAGDKVIISHENKDTATVTSVDVSPASILAFNSVEGKYAYQEDADKADILVTLEASGTESDAVIFIGSTPVKIGKSSVLRSTKYSASGFIVKADASEK